MVSMPRLLHSPKNKPSWRLEPGWDGLRHGDLQAGEGWQDSALGWLSLPTTCSLLQLPPGKTQPQAALGRRPESPCVLWGGDSRVPWKMPWAGHAAGCRHGLIASA